MKFTYIIILLSVFVCCKNKEKEQKRNNKSVQKKVTFENKTLKELQILRNEIYAKKGYYFKDSKLFAHFSKYDWYQPQQDIKITLSVYEKTQVEKIQNLEHKLKSLINPKGFKIKKKSIIKVDFDNDEIEDIAFIATDGVDCQEGGREPLFIYLSSNKKRHMFDLPSFDYNWLTHSQENNSFKYSATLEGTGRIENTFVIKYNNNISKVELIGYSRGSRANISDSKEFVFDIKKGEYMMTYYNYNPKLEKSEIFKRHIGTKNKSIKADFTYSYYHYLDTLGLEFEDY